MLQPLRWNLTAMNVSEGGEEVLKRNRWPRGAVLFDCPGPTNKATQQVRVEYCPGCIRAFQCGSAGTQGITAAIPYRSERETQFIEGLGSAPASGWSPGDFD